MATINDVAERAGVSKSSVSRVINNNIEYMAEETKNKIIEAMEELNFVPNQIAQSLKRKTTTTIGIILSDISNPFWSEVLKGVQHECTSNGFSLMVSSSGESSKFEEENILNLKNRLVDGIIVNTAGENFDLFSKLINEDYPLVFLDRFPQEMNADTVIVNNILGASRATQNLIDQGHERIAIVSYSLENKSPRIDRLEGYKKTLMQNSISIDDDLIKICGQEPRSGIRATKELLTLEKKPTAIFSTNTILNLEVLTGIKDNGLNVPGDISVIGYDDYAWVPLLDPPLSTVAQPAFELGVEAARLLIQRVKKVNSDLPKIIQLDPELILRESCAVPTVNTPE